MSTTASSILRDNLTLLIKEERLKRNLTLAQVAIECELTAATLEKMEQEGSEVSVNKYLRLLRYYKKRIKMELVDSIVYR